jgi:hypothetical protein
MRMDASLLSPAIDEITRHRLSRLPGRAAGSLRRLFRKLVAVGTRRFFDASCDGAARASVANFSRSFSRSRLLFGGRQHRRRSCVGSVADRLQELERPICCRCYKTFYLPALTRRPNKLGRSSLPGLFLPNLIFNR